MNSMLQAVLQATLVSKAVLLLLLLMSLASWAYMFGKWVVLKRAQKKSLEELKTFDSSSGLLPALSAIHSDDGTPLFGITRRAVREFNRINRTGDAEKLLNDNVRRALHFGIAEEMSSLRSSLSFLATTANTAPFIGLFGTVWGIMHSFHAIALQKSVSLATVAPGIAEALIATAVGLFVAIPATCGYNTFRSKLSSIEGVCINFAGQLLNRLQHEAGAHPNGIDFAGEKGERS